MAYSLNTVYMTFKREVDELNIIVNKLSERPQSLERDTHLEGCFIRLVVCWEVFCEEYFLRCLCHANTRSGRQILKPLGTRSKNLKEAFKKVSGGRRDKSKDYIDWLDSTLVKQRLNDNFRSNSRVQTLIEAPEKFFELRVIRNAIAHKSDSAVLKFEKFVKDQLGYLSSLNPTMADLLVMERRNSNKLIFLVLSEYFLNLSDKLTR